MSQILEDKDLGLKEPVDSLESSLRRAETEVQTGMSKRKTKESPQKSKTSHVSSSYLCTFRRPDFDRNVLRQLTVTPRHHPPHCSRRNLLQNQEAGRKRSGLVGTKLVKVNILSEAIAAFKVLKITRQQLLVTAWWPGYILEDKKS
jgi:hypothetical protein